MPILSRGKLMRRNFAHSAALGEPPPRTFDKEGTRFVRDARAQVAELVDALVSGTSDASRGGSSPLLGTKNLNDTKAGTST